MVSEFFAKILFLLYFIKCASAECDPETAYNTIIDYLESDDYDNAFAPNLPLNVTSFFEIRAVTKVDEINHRVGFFAAIM